MVVVVIAIVMIINATQRFLKLGHGMADDVELIFGTVGRTWEPEIELIVEGAESPKDVARFFADGAEEAAKSRLVVRCKRDVVRFLCQLAGRENEPHSGWTFAEQNARQLFGFELDIGSALDDAGSGFAAVIGKSRCSSDEQRCSQQCIGGFHRILHGGYG